MREEGRESREERAWRDAGRDRGTGATFSIAMSESARTDPQVKPDHPNGEETPRVIVNPSVVAILLALCFQPTVRTLTTPSPNRGATPTTCERHEVSWRVRIIYVQVQVRLSSAICPGSARERGSTECY